LRAPAVAAAILFVILGAARSWTRSGTWRDTETVLATLAEDHPESFRAQWWVAGRLVQAGSVERGLDRMEEAVRLNANDAFIRLDQVRLLLVAGRPAEAEEKLRSIPEGMSPTWHAYRVQSLADRGLMEEAREAARRGLERFPGNELLSGQAAALGVIIPSTR
jgi:predicted Zn-dependent protease